MVILESGHVLKRSSTMEEKVCEGCTVKHSSVELRPNDMNMCDMCWGKPMSNDSIVDRSDITAENGAELEDHLNTIVLYDDDDEAIEDRPIVAISNLSTNLDTEPSGNTKEADEEESEITVANVTNTDQCQSPTNKNDSLEELRFRKAMYNKMVKSKVSQNKVPQ